MIQEQVLIKFSIRIAEYADSSSTVAERTFFSESGLAAFFNESELSVSTYTVILAISDRPIWARQSYSVFSNVSPIFLYEMSAYAQRTDMNLAFGFHYTKNQVRGRTFDLKMIPKTGLTFGSTLYTHSIHSQQNVRGREYVEYRRACPSVQNILLEFYKKKFQKNFQKCFEL